ncbi:macrophage migration inhibition factor-like protein [Medicago truncatula]|uniref:Macrophage migration inhibition factor-like protein n=1 Tax=Medicago truncatula TaxID=3880 RepID=A0A072U0D2_MEDTR|nr:macrophage migration inhibition factor-like protein [Medicago truncatula]
MPCLTLSTNVSFDGVDISSILSQLNSTIANILGYPKSYVTVSLEGSIPICFGETEEPAAYGEFVAIGILNPDLNKKLSAEIALVLHTMLLVPKSRFYLKFYDIEVPKFTVLNCF